MPNFYPVHVFTTSERTECVFATPERCPSLQDFREDFDDMRGNFIHFIIVVPKVRELIENTFAEPFVPLLVRADHAGERIGRQRFFLEDEFPEYY